MPLLQGRNLPKVPCAHMPFADEVEWDNGVLWKFPSVPEIPIQYHVITFFYLYNKKMEHGKTILINLG
ncbi:MAG: hypothetical protein LWX51_14030 [Deltaproteobacteria bacterium]|nr:hypothetical protein [Deltaproteobacteria bacterium]